MFDVEKLKQNNELSKKIKADFDNIKSVVKTKYQTDVNNLKEVKEAIENAKLGYQVGDVLQENQVKEYNITKLEKTWGLEGGCLWVETDDEGNKYVVKSNSVEKYSPAGMKLTEYSISLKKLYFNDGNLFGYSGKKIYKFTKDFKEVWTTTATKNINKGLFFDNAGNFWVSEDGIEKFSSEGGKILYKNDPPFKGWVEDIFIDSENRVIIPGKNIKIDSNGEVIKNDYHFKNDWYTGFDIDEFDNIFEGGEKILIKYDKNGDVLKKIKTAVSSDVVVVKNNFVYLFGDGVIYKFDNDLNEQWNFTVATTAKIRIGKVDSVGNITCVLYDNALSNISNQGFTSYKIIK